MAGGSKCLSTNLGTLDPSFFSFFWRWREGVNLGLIWFSLVLISWVSTFSLIRLARFHWMLEQRSHWVHEGALHSVHVHECSESDSVQHCSCSVAYFKEWIRQLNPCEVHWELQVHEGEACQVGIQDHWIAMSDYDSVHRKWSRLQISREIDDG